VQYDLLRINRDVAQEQQESGTEVDWWFYDIGGSTGDEYDEGGRRWKGPFRIPVLDARRVPGPLQDGSDGQYYRDTLTIRMNYEQSRLAGITPDIQTNTGAHLSDRIVYMGRVWNVFNIDVQGQFEPENKEVTVTVYASQVRPDELVDDTDFAAYSA
jgi:hypothetical protein